MNVHWIHLLWLLVLPVGFIIAELTRRVRAAARTHPKILRAEASASGLAMLPGNQAAPEIRVRWRFWLGLALAIVAFARPQWGEVEEPVFDQAREILIAIDLSRSMLAPDVPPSRLDRGKLLITSLLERLAGERVGLIVFAGTSLLQSPLSADYEILREFLPELGPEYLPQGGTNYSALLDTALEAFGEDSEADRFLIVLSDGESQTESWTSRVGDLRKRGVKVISLGIGTPDGAMLPDGDGGFVKDERGAVVLSKLNHSTLEDLARRTEGVYRDASSWIDLAVLLDQTVEAGRQGEFTETRRARMIERFQWFLGPSLLMLLWSFWREFPVQPRQRAISLNRHSPTTAASMASALGMMLWSGGFDELRAATPDETSQLGAPLAELVSQLSASDSLGARDFADLAETTVNYGQQSMAAGQKPSLGAINDGLDAVDAGENLNEFATDWPALREELERMRDQLEEPDPEEQSQQDQENQDQSENEQQDDSSEDQSGENGDQSEQNESEQSDGENGESGEQNDSESSESDQQSDSSENGQEGDDQQSGEPNPSQESAFGDMGEESETPRAQPEAESQPEGDMQRVGGQREERPFDQENTQLTIPLQKLDQLKQQDSPATLYQLMQDPTSAPPTGRDW